MGFVNNTVAYNKKKARKLGKLYGSIELAPVLNLSDFIVDIVESGRTLKENGLKQYDKISDISSLLISNKVSYKLKRKEIDSFLKMVETV